MTHAELAGFRLSPGQVRTWRLMAVASPNVYRGRCIVHSSEPWELARVEDALRQVSARHEILRTTFRTLAGMTLPLQTPGSPEQAFACLASESASPPECFALVEGNDLVLSFSALCGDGPTYLLAVQEFIEAYVGQELSDEPLQFCDLAEWQHELLEQDCGEHDVWAGAVLNSTEATSGSLPALQIRTGVLFSPAEWPVEIQQQVISSLSVIAEAHGVTIADLLLSAWSTLLWRLGNRSSIAFMTNGRGDPALNTALGPLARSVPLMVLPKEGQAFSDLMREVADARQAVEVIEHHIAPLAQESKARFSFSPHVIPKLREGFSIDRLRVRDDEFLVRLCALIHADCVVSLTFDYDENALSAASIARLAEEYSTLLASIIENVDGAIEELEIVGPQEREQLLVAFQGKVAPAREPWRPVHHLVMDLWRNDLETIALQQDDVCLTGAELVDRVDTMAARLARCGIGRGARVAILLPRCPDLVIAMLAILENGAAYVPLDPDYPVDRLNYMLADSKAAAVITTSDLKTLHIDATSLQTICLDEVVETERSSKPVSVICGGEDVVYLLYTSGSTGRPKGVVIPHSALSNHMDWMERALPLLKSDVVLQKTAVSFDASVWEFFAPLLAGARLVLAPEGAERDPKLMIASIRNHGATIVQMVPTLLRMLLEETDFAECKSLRRVCCGGEALSVDLAQRFHKMMPSVQLVNLYGPTESTIEVTSEQIQVGEVSITIGRPIDNARIYVLDGLGRPSPIGVPGEIYIGGPVLAKSYHNQPELTAERFLNDRFHAVPGARMYRSGDFGAWREDGRLDYFGRGDQQIKLRGFRIEFGEIEAIAESHPGVLRAAVAITRDDAAIDQLICCYVARNGATLDASSLKTYLQLSLPEYMVPNWCIQADALPMTPAGKLDRMSLAKMRPALAGTSGAPRDAVEMRLIQIWEDVLNVYPIGINANFFDLGGHSLLAVRLMSEVQREFGANLPLASLFSAQTIVLQADLLRNTDISQDSVLIPIRNAHKSKHPIFFIHPTGGAVLCYSDIARHLGDYPVYGLQDPGLQGDADYNTIEELAQIYVDRIEPLVGDNPYFLAGWSSGGVIAYAMASRLMARGRRVGMLAMIDSSAADESSEPADPLRLCQSIARLLAYHGGFATPAISASTHAGRLEDLLSLAKRAGVLPESADLAQVERLFDVFRRNVDAIGRYRPPEYPRRALLLRATKPVPEAVAGAALQKSSNFQTAGWERLCNIIVAEVGADHMSIVAEPCAQIVASILMKEASEASRIHELDRLVMFPMLGV